MDEDIEYRLRERGCWGDGGKTWEQDQLCAEAAAEIRKLRAELKSAYDAWRGRCRVIDERDDEIGRRAAALGSQR